MTIHKLIRNGPVFPVVPAYDKSGGLDYDKIGNYLGYLSDEGARTIMTTAGTTQFNYLSLEEIQTLNLLVSGIGEFTNRILGLPPLPLRDLKEALRKMRLGCQPRQCSLLLLYPDRYYNDETIVRYFHEAGDASNLPIFIHAQFMRDGRGGIYNYTPQLIRKIQQHPRIIGMKEEHQTFKGAYDLCNELRYEDFTIIVAGGDQRRFLLTEPVGAHTFLVGAGSIFPIIDQCFFNVVKEGRLNEARKILNGCHNPVYDTFKEIGWHRALRNALRKYTGYDKQPFPAITIRESERIKMALEQAEGFIQ